MNKLGLSPKKQVPFDVDEDDTNEVNSKTKLKCSESLGKQGGSRQDFIKLYHKTKRK